MTIKNPSQELKNLFVLGSYEPLERLNGKAAEAPFFKVQSGKMENTFFFSLFSGSIKAWDDLVNGKSDLGQGFDLVAGTLLEAGGAALGVKALKGKTTISKTVGLGLMKGKKARIRPTLRCRRSIEDNPRFGSDPGFGSDTGFGLDQPDVSKDLLPRLRSFNDMSFSESMPGMSLVDNVLSVFLVLQLMKIRHPRSRPFFNEV